MPRKIYLGLELKHRELESKLGLAYHLVARGFEVILGQQWAIFNSAGSLPEGTILFKTVNEIQAANMANFRARGHRIAAHDEEALICVSENCFMQAFSEKAARNCDLFFAQNEFQKAAIESKYDCLRKKVVVVGSPRVDLLRQDPSEDLKNEARKIIAAFGPFVLFNTNFGSINSIWKNLDNVAQIAINAGVLNVKDKNSIKEFKSLLQWELDNRNELERTIKWATINLPEHRIVIRPHPGEAPEYWQKKFNLKNVTVIPRSNPHPWILAADLVIHTGCTTGLEAMLLKRPAINIQPTPHPVFDRLVNHINHTVTNWVDATSLINELLKVTQPRIQQSSPKHLQFLHEYFPVSPECSVVESMATELSNLANLQPEFPCLESTCIRPLLRTDVQRDKFSLSKEELLRSINSLGGSCLASSQIEVKELTDSLFTMVKNVR